MTSYAKRPGKRPLCQVARRTPNVKQPRRAWKPWRRKSVGWKAPAAGGCRVYGSAARRARTTRHPQQTAKGLCRLDRPLPASIQGKKQFTLRATVHRLNSTGLSNNQCHSGLRRNDIGGLGVSFIRRPLASSQFFGQLLGVNWVKQTLVGHFVRF